MKMKIEWEDPEIARIGSTILLDLVKQGKQSRPSAQSRLTHPRTCIFIFLFLFHYPGRYRCGGPLRPFKIEY